MKIHTGTVTNLDRIALSNELFELADHFLDESKQWKPKNRAELERTARHLSELARHVLTGVAEFARAEAFRDGGATLLGETIAQRRFLHALITPPSEVHP